MSANSMTGYGRGAFKLNRRAFCVELRSYNNRFLDVKVRLPWPGKELETKVEKAVRARVHRGRVDVSVWEEVGSGGPGRLQLHQGLAEDLSGVLAQLTGILGCDQATAVGLLPPMRELVSSEPGLGLETDAIWEPLEQGLGLALGQLIQMRAREGAATEEDLRGHLSQLEDLCEKIRGHAGGEPELHRQRLLARLEGWEQEGVAVAPERVAQEVALMADRCDVSEELARLQSHISQLSGILEQTEPVGRKTEFLLQEFNRELNTIASKSLSAETAHLAVDAKACVERMREQAQNVE